VSAKKILVIDDERAIRDMLRLHLEKKGYKIMTASNGEEGLHLAKREKPDLIVLDLEMPKKDGFEVFCEMSTGHAHTKLPILVTTGRGEFQDLFLKLDAAGFVAKPFEMSDLLSEVNHILEGRPQKHVFVADLTSSPHAVQIAAGLERERFKVTWIDSLDTLRKFAVLRRPDFFLMEYMQNKIPGEIFIHETRNILPGVPLFVYSSSGLDYKDKSLRAGADRYLEQPLHAEKVVTALIEFEMKQEQSGKPL